MKKTVLYLLGMGVIALAPISAKAANEKVDFSCPDTANPGEVVSCSVTYEADEVTINSVSFNYELGTGVTYDSFTFGGSFDVPIYNALGVAAGNTAGLTSNNIGTAKFKLPADATSNQTYTIGITNVALADTNDTDYDLESVTETVRIKSNNNKLSALNVTGATVDFDAGKNKYDLTIDADHTTINATKADEHATISGTGEKALKYGLNTFEIKVTSETGITNTYTLNITRPDNRSTDKDLLKFEFNDYKIDFKADKQEYEVTVEHNISKLYECTKDVKSDKYICINYDVLDYNGENFFYKLNGKEIYSDIIYHDAYDNGEEKCENKVCTYSVDGEVLITYNEETDEEIYNLPLGELKVGKNTFEVIVTAENETTKTYTFNITRKADPKAESTVKNPETGLYVGIGVVGFISILSAGLYFFMKRKNKFPQA